MKSIIIYSFMIKDLKLKGLELLVYALIYSFSQFDKKLFMDAETIAHHLGSSRSQVFRVLRSLLKKQFILYDYGYYCKCNESIDPDLQDKLADLIRIAKTPWIND